MELVRDTTNAMNSIFSANKLPFGASPPASTCDCGPLHQRAEMEQATNSFKAIFSVNSMKSAIASLFQSLKSTASSGRTIVGTSASNGRTMIGNTASSGARMIGKTASSGRTMMGHTASSGASLLWYPAMGTWVLSIMVCFVIALAFYLMNATASWKNLRVLKGQEKIPGSKRISADGSSGINKSAKTSRGVNFLPDLKKPLTERIPGLKRSSAVYNSPRSATSAHRTSEDMPGSSGSAKSVFGNGPSQRGMTSSDESGSTSISGLTSSMTMNKPFSDASGGSGVGMSSPQGGNSKSSFTFGGMAQSVARALDPYGDSRSNIPSGEANKPSEVYDASRSRFAPGGGGTRDVPGFYNSSSSDGAFSENDSYSYDDSRMDLFPAERNKSSNSRPISTAPQSSGTGNFSRDVYDDSWSAAASPMPSQIGKPANSGYGSYERKYLWDYENFVARVHGGHVGGNMASNSGLGSSGMKVPSDDQYYGSRAMSESTNPSSSDLQQARPRLTSMGNNETSNSGFGLSGINSNVYSNYQSNESKTTMGPTSAGQINPSNSGIGPSGMDDRNDDGLDRPWSTRSMISEGLKKSSTSRAQPEDVYNDSSMTSGLSSTDASFPLNACDDSGSSFASNPSNSGLMSCEMSKYTDDVYDKYRSNLPAAGENKSSDYGPMSTSQPGRYSGDAYDEAVSSGANNPANSGWGSSGMQKFSDDAVSDSTSSFKSAGMNTTSNYDLDAFSSSRLAPTSSSKSTERPAAIYTSPAPSRGTHSGRRPVSDADSPPIADYDPVTGLASPPHRGHDPSMPVSVAGLSSPARSGRSSAGRDASPGKRFHKKVAQFASKLTGRKSLLPGTFEDGSSENYRDPFSSGFTSPPPGKNYTPQSQGIDISSNDNPDTGSGAHVSGRRDIGGHQQMHGQDTEAMHRRKDSGIDVDSHMPGIFERAGHRIHRDGLGGVKEETDMPGGPGVFEAPQQHMVGVGGKMNYE